MRKDKPTLIYREEVTADDPRWNSTRQTFDRAKFDAWRAYDDRNPLPDITREYFVGRIDWR